MLLDVLDTPVSPELLPPKDGEIAQKTEDLVGPYELHDFYLYYFLRFGYEPAKILPARQGSLRRRSMMTRRSTEMAVYLLPEIFYPAVQALLPAGRAKGRNGGLVAQRGLADAKRRLCDGLACGS